jgi:hypothetical protein
MISEIIFDEFCLNVDRSKDENVSENVFNVSQVLQGQVVIGSYTKAKIEIYK